MKKLLPSFLLTTPHCVFVSLELLVGLCFGKNAKICCSFHFCFPYKAYLPTSPPHTRNKNLDLLYKMKKKESLGTCSERTKAEKLNKK